MMGYTESDSGTENYEVRGVIKEANELQQYRFKSAYERTHSTEQPDNHS